MKKLLYLVHRIPFPPNKGDKIPSFNMLKYFSRDFEIYLGTFIDIQEDWQYVENVKEYCQDVCVVGINPSAAKLKSLTGLLTGKPLSLPYYANNKMQAWVDTVLSDVKPDAVLLFSGVTAQFVTGKLGSSVQSVMDFIDVDSDKWRLYSERHSWPMSWIYARESRKLLEYERFVAKEMDASVFVSEKEAEFFKSLAPEVANKINWRVQGVDSEFFDPDLEMASPYETDQKVMVFVGAMDYWPNIDAACWFAESIFPDIKNRIPEAVFCVVGMNPTDQVKQLAEIKGVTVTGSVDDVRPYMKYAYCSIAPLRVARGIQNKVLEALSMGNRVVATDNALTGIDFYDYQPNQADEEASFAEACISELQQQRQLDLDARQLVLDHYNWESSLKKVKNLLES